MYKINLNLRSVVASILILSISIIGYFLFESNIKADQNSSSTSKHYVEGRITDNMGNGLKGKLYLTDGLFVKVVRTNDMGYFEIDRIYQKYNVQISFVGSNNYSYSEPGNEKGFYVLVPGGNLELKNWHLDKKLI